ncbi:hypothetical protein D3C74_190080 [compost metagenome]
MGNHLFSVGLLLKIYLSKLMGEFTGNYSSPRSTRILFKQVTKYRKYANIYI